MGEPCRTCPHTSNNITAYNRFNFTNIINESVLTTQTVHMNKTENILTKHFANTSFESSSVIKQKVFFIRII